MELKLLGTCIIYNAIYLIKQKRSFQLPIPGFYCSRQKAVRTPDRVKLLKHNPMAGIIMPKRKTKPSENFWSVQELQEFLTILLKEEPYKHYVLFRLLAYSGLRKGELYTLKWADIDLAKGLLSISKSLGRLNGKSLVKGTKNHFSIRKIKLDSETISILRSWKEQTQKEKA